MQVGATAVLEVSTRLLHEGVLRIDEDVDSALVALRQSFALECSYTAQDDDGARLCRSCTGLCRALTKANNGDAPAAAVPVLLQVRPTRACRPAPWRARGRSPSSGRV